MRKKYINFYENKAIKTLISINIVQVIILVSIGIYAYFIRDISSKQDLKIISVIIITIILINSYISIKDSLILNRLSYENKLKSESLLKIENLNNTLRSQRHDFLNHLQVVYSLIEMDEYEEASSYIETTYQDIQKVNKILKTSNIAINALLQAKLNDCDRRNIKLKLNISSVLDNLVIPPWEMCRVLGNIIDNAIYATEKIKDKYINIEIYEKLKNYMFIVENNGKEIPDYIKTNIFKPGFTTKKDKGEGMGLAISKEIIEKYNGEITFSSDKNKTIFKINIPMCLETIIATIEA